MDASVSEKADGLYPMYLGVSCAFTALKLMSKSEFNEGQWLEIREKLLQGSAHLLGILMWKIQKSEAVEEGRSELVYNLGKARMEIEELKNRRREDAKANEKVVSIFASQEQSWLREKKKLKQQVMQMFSVLESLKRKNEEIVSNLNEKVQAKELVIQSRDKALEDAEVMKKDLEEKLQKAEAITVELREAIDKEAQKHTSELWKHKTAFMELVSNQRQLEAEMGRALRQVEVAKQELDTVTKEKEESALMIQQLSMEVVKTRKDSEQKEKILSAMLRKSKLDTAEKETLLQELKISKTKRKQMQIEMERYRTQYELICDRNSSSNPFSHTYKNRAHIQGTTNMNNPRKLLLDYMEVERQKDCNCITPKKTLSVVSDSYIPERGRFELTTADAKQLEDWVSSQREKNAIMLEQRHQLEIEAFAEQLRLKDEKLEALRWQILSMELESKRSQFHTEALDKGFSQLRKENMKLEASLLDRSAEVKALSKEFTGLHGKANNSLLDLTKDHKAIWSDVKIIKTKPKDLQVERCWPQEVDSKEEEQIPIDKSVDTNLIVEARENEIEEKKVVTIDRVRVERQHVGSDKTDFVTKLESYGHSFIKKDNSTRKMNLHSLGVSYNIKRMKQQLLLVDKLVGMSRSCQAKEPEDNSHFRTKGFVVLMSQLNKQVSRYQSLQEKIDDLCKRMHEIDFKDCDGGSRFAKTRKETKTLENFLEETLQLQRCMVAIGQKLVEIQSRIASGFTSTAEDAKRSSSFDTKRFAHSTRTIFNEVQKGLEVQIAQIMGDLEETLACDGIIHS